MKLSDLPLDPVPDRPIGRGALAALALAGLLAALATSIANVALPALADAFAAPFQAVQWVVLAYLLAITTLIVSVGRLGDLLGRKRLLLAGIAAFTLASALCAAAPSLGGLIAARAVQGLGAAVMMALSMAFIGDLVPKSQAGRTVGLLGTMSAVGTALGPALGGVLIAAAGWPANFLVNLPLGLLAFWLAYRHLPDAPRAATADAADARFDWPGTLLLAATLSAYCLAVTLGRGHFDAINAILLLLAAVGGAAFIRHTRRAPSPLLRLSTLAAPALRAGLTQSLLVSTVMMATLVVGPFYLSRSLSLDAAHVGLVLSAGPLVAALTAVPAGRLADRLGAGRVVRFGLAGLLLGTAALALLPSALGVAAYLGPLLVMTGSYALFQTANNAGILTAAGPAQRGAVAGLLNLARNLGLVTGAAVLGTVFAAASGGSDAAAVARGMRITFAVAALLVAGALVLARAAGRARTPPRAAAPAGISR